jgi:RNA polymerase sigma-70 factor (ECF subfamily)
MNQDRIDGRLVEEAQAGDRAAIHAIYEHFAPRIYNFLLKMLGSREEAEDVTQQAFVIVLRQLKGLRDARQLESWIYRIARNEVYQGFRRKKVLQLESGDAAEYSDVLEEHRMHGNPEQALLNVELGQLLQSALGGLPLKMREVFVLAVVQGMSYQEVSAITGRSLLAVKTDIYRARLNLRERLKGYMDSGIGAGTEKK